MDRFSYCLAKAPLATLNLLYTCFSFGEVSVDDSGAVLSIDKALLKRHYKRGGVARKAEWSATHGPNFSWLSDDGYEVDLRKASTASLTYLSDRNLIPAVKSFVNELEATDADSKLSSGSHFICIKHHL